MKSPITKGQWYYEFQIVWFVFMWQHDKEYKPVHTHGFRWGRIFIWYDTAWKHNGCIRKIREWKEDKIDPILIFLRSLWAFLILSKAGFRITSSPSKSTSLEYVLFRFWWKDKVIKDMADIDFVKDNFYTMLNGHSEKL